MEDAIIRYDRYLISATGGPTHHPMPTSPHSPKIAPHPIPVHCSRQAWQSFGEKCEKGSAV
eukprot:9037002-Pyramimonas_sp.AAC.1